MIPNQFILTALFAFLLGVSTTLIVLILLVRKAKVQTEDKYLVEMRERNELDKLRNDLLATIANNLHELKHRLPADIQD